MFSQRTLYSQVSRCKHCGCFVDRYFEFSTTLRLIELFLVRESILRHFMFNSPLSKRSFFFYAATLLWIRTMLSIRSSSLCIGLHEKTDLCTGELLVKIPLYMCLSLFDYAFYAFCIKLLDSDTDVSTAVIFRTVVFSSYFQLFNFLSMVWCYKDFVVYEFVADALTFFANLRSVSVLSKRPPKSILLRTAASRMLSTCVVSLLRSFLSLCLGCSS